MAELNDTTSERGFNSHKISYWRVSPCDSCINIYCRDIYIYICVCVCSCRAIYLLIWYLFWSTPSSFCFVLFAFHWFVLNPDDPATLFPSLRRATSAWIFICGSRFNSCRAADQFLDRACAARITLQWMVFKGTFVSSRKLNACSTAQIWKNSVKMWP